MERQESEAAAIGHAIVRLRTRVPNLTTNALAKRAGMNPAYLGKVEKAEGKRPGVAIIGKIARALGITTDALLAEAGIFPRVGPIPTDLDVLYQQLDEPSRIALLENAHTLRELRERYDAALTEHEELRVAEGGEELEEVPDAAHPVTEEIREARKDAEDFEER